MQLCIIMPSALFSCYDINEIRHISTKIKGSDCMKRSKTYLKCLALSAVFASSALVLSTPAAYAQTTSQVVTDIGQNAKTHTSYNTFNNDQTDNMTMSLKVTFIDDQALINRLPLLIQLVVF